MSSFGVGSILLLVILYYAILCESSSMALLGMALAVLMGYSFFSLFFRRGKIRAKLEVPMLIAEKDRKFFLRVAVSNDTGRACAKAVFKISYKNSMEKKAYTTALTAQALPPGKSFYQYELLITEPGCYEFRLSRLFLYDSFGIFCWKRRMQGGVNALVLPEICGIPVRVGERVRNFYGDADVYDDLRPGYDPGEVFDVRQFRDGDKLPGVLWKLTAKTGELMVRENSLPKACPVRFFLYSYGGRSQWMLERIAAAAFSVMDAGCAFYAVWMSRSRKDLLRARVDDEESFYQFLVSYMQDCSESDSEDLEERYREKYRGECAVHSLCFRDGRIFQNGQELKGRMMQEILLD